MFAGIAMSTHPFPGLMLRLLLLVACAAMPSIAEAIDPATRQLRERQAQIRALEQEQRLRQWQSRTRPTDAKRATPAPPAHDRCWPIAGARLVGNQVLSDQALKDVVGPLLRPCMSVADINDLLKAITARYIRAGYPATRPYLARLPGSEPTLEVMIVEGFVESIELAEPTLPLSLRGAFPDLLGEPLHLPALEQGLDQINRLKAFSVSADLLPGERPGATRLVIQPDKLGKRWHATVRLDNRASETTGRHRATLGLALDSPLALNDYLGLSFNTLLPDAKGHSQGAGLYYNVPYGPWSLALALHRIDYRASPDLPARPSGDSRFESLGVSRMLWRNDKGLLAASARLDHKRLANRVRGRRTAVQSTRLTVVEAGLEFFWLQGGVWSARLGVSQGLDHLGADEAPLKRNAAQPNFRKYRASLARLDEGSAALRWRWQSELDLQYSPDSLPAVEQFALSDDMAVRGFRQRYVAGASGATWRNTLSHPLPLPGQPGIELRVHAGLDLGWSRFDHGRPSQRLVGSALGLQLTLPGARLRVDHQRALRARPGDGKALEPGFWVMEWTLEM